MTRGLDRLAEPLYRLPFEAPIATALQAEFAALPAARRRQAVRKLWQREALLRWTGQARLRREKVPSDARRVLWVTTWTTVGDAILDLAARAVVPPSIALELCIAPALAPLFMHDARFAKVHVDPAACGAGFDFVLLDVLSTTSIRLKAQYFARVPFANLRGHLLGERFDRAAFSDWRIRQLFGLATGEVVVPWLTFGPGGGGDAGAGPLDADEFRLAVPLGARVAEKRYPHWPAALAYIAANWPLPERPPRFVLLGHGANAEADLASFDAGFLARHTTLAIGPHRTLADAARAIAGCDAFLGVDGGLMHMAIALGVPGLAVFPREVDPAWFLRPGSSMAALRIDGDPAGLAPEELARRFLARLAALSV